MSSFGQLEVHDDLPPTSPVLNQNPNTLQVRPSEILHEKKAPDGAVLAERTYCLGQVGGVIASYRHVGLIDDAP